MSSNTDFSSVSEWLDLVPVGESEEGVPETVLRNLYKYARGDLGKPAMIMGSSRFKNGWVDGTASVAAQLLEDVVPSESGVSGRGSRGFLLQKQLEAVPWKRVLGIEEPIRIEVRSHGRLLAFRFVSGVPALKGRERINGELPPLDDGQLGVREEPTALNSVEESKGTDAVDDILRQGGLL